MPKVTTGCYHLSCLLLIFDALHSFLRIIQFTITKLDVFIFWIILGSGVLKVLFISKLIFLYLQTMYTFLVN